MAGLGGSFSSFWQVSKSWPFLEEFIFRSAPKLILATLGSFGPSGGGHSVASSSWLVLGSLFHSFGRCPNYGDFLGQLIPQGAPKLVLVTLAPFGLLGGTL